MARDDFWPTFGTNGLSTITTSYEGTTSSLASDVLSTFGISCTGSRGGSLEGLDIKNMDALAVINLSFLEYYGKTGTLLDIVANDSGGVSIITVGGSSCNLNDIYYQIQSDSYKSTCAGVLVRGGTPMPYWEDTDWVSIWGNGGKQVFDYSMFVSNCSDPELSSYAMIIFNDPNLDTSYNDGIDNLYDMVDPIKQTFMGYARYMSAPGSTDYTKITYNDSGANIPIVVCNGESMGTLIEPPKMLPELEKFGGADCWSGSNAGISSSDGLKIPIPDTLRYTDVRGVSVDKFKSVTDVFIIGTPLSLVKAAPYNNDSAAITVPPTEESYTAIINIDSSTRNVFKLNPGKDYIILYEDGIPYIVFSKNTRENDPLTYGPETSYVIGNGGKYSIDREGETGKATIFPVANNKGYIVDQVVAFIDIDMPSISIYDPEYNGDGSDGASSKAIDIANNFIYELKPLILNNPPAPIAFNGSLIEQGDSVVDTDPTTVQDLSDTPLEKVLDKLNGGGYEITMSSLTNETTIKTMSRNLNNLMSNDDGVETTYVCGPTCEATLGSSGPGGGVINSIVYTYTDQGSYTISVNEGSKLIKSFSGGGVTGATPKATETVTAQGKVIQSMGNGVNFKVKLDGFGDRVAINTCHSIIRVGDVVNCSIHNNPVEL